MQQGDFINVFLARHVSSTYAHHQEHQTLSCSIWFSAPSFWIGGGLESTIYSIYSCNRGTNVANVFSGILIAKKLSYNYYEWLNVTKYLMNLMTKSGNSCQ